jgi:hypothetical protein
MLHIHYKYFVYTIYNKQSKYKIPGKIKDKLVSIISEER